MQRGTTDLSDVLELSKATEEPPKKKSKVSSPPDDIAAAMAAAMGGMAPPGEMSVANCDSELQDMGTPFLGYLWNLPPDMEEACNRNRDFVPDHDGIVTL